MVLSMEEDSRKAASPPHASPVTAFLCAARVARQVHSFTTLTSMLPALLPYARYTPEGSKQTEVTALPPPRD